MRPEEKIEKKFVEECKRLGVDAYKFEVPGKRGAPDRMVLMPEGKILFVEFKVPLGKLSSQQRAFIKELQIKRFDVMVATDVKGPLKLVKEIMHAKRT